MKKAVIAACFLRAALLMVPSFAAHAASAMLPAQWSEGATDCAADPQPTLQVHQYDPGTFILRENPCATAEAPFMYLLLGSKRALLVDTGDVADAAQVPLADTVMGLLPDGMPLLVVHTHGHLDHRAGDAQFAPLAAVEVVGTELGQVQAFFGFDRWPAGVAQVELGDRVMDVVPTPGHHPTHITLYDRETALLFTGDFFLPGRLLVDDLAADIASAKRIAAFIEGRPVSHVLGAHVELDASGELFPFRSRHRPDAHVLQLGRQDILALPAMLEDFNGLYGTRGKFTMLNPTRQLLLLGAAALLLVGAAVATVVWLMRRRSARARVDGAAAGH